MTAADLRARVEAMSDAEKREFAARVMLFMSKHEHEIHCNPDGLVARFWRALKRTAN